MTIDRAVLFVGLSLGCYSAAIAGDAGANVSVHKVAEDFQESPWQADPWSNAKGETSLLQEPPSTAGAAGSLKLDVHFSGKGFEHFTVCPSKPLWIPGNAKTITLRCKLSEIHYAFKMDFIDGWGRSQAEGASMSWDLRPDPTGDWKTATFHVPESWVRPVGISGLTMHNWEAQNVRKTVHAQIGEIKADTDIKDVDPKSGLLTGWKPEPHPANADRALRQCPPTPLIVADISSGEQSNVFTLGQPQVRVRLQNWKPGVLTGKLACRLTDAAGDLIEQFERPITIDSSAGLAVPLKTERFGLYTLAAKLTLSDGADRAEQMVLARLPAAKDLSEKQKLASPYGLNVHSGSKIVLEPFRKAGIVWFREYAFEYDWLLRAKGEDGKYAGWPYYPKIVAAYQQSGGKCLPVIQHSIKPPVVVNGKAAGRIGPDRQWTREICSLVNAFPELSHWELSNEYDLPADNYKPEEAIDWANYRAYHRQFANILDLLGGGELVAVENGRAGIWPQRVRRCVQSGDFDHIAVVNSHHYCGADPPETNLANFNMGTETHLPSFLFDELRAVKRAAQVDGKCRQSWLTEFGWDTLAGPVVSPYQQAVYLPRAWMVAMAAGTDKAFWFYNFDASKAVQFFDGCGLLSANGEPKLSLCSLAGLTSVLPNPVYVGDLDAGPNTCGYVFRNDGKLVAALWTIQGDNGPTVNFQAEKVLDYLGNKLQPGPVRLSMAPVYAVGLSAGDRWRRQTAYSLETPHMMTATAGDPVRLVVRVDNRRASPIAARLELALPEGWKAATSEVAVNVAPGEVKNVELAATIPFAEELGVKELQVVVSEEAELKRMTVKVQVQSPLELRVNPLEGRPGTTKSTILVENRSARSIRGILSMHLPTSWQALTPEISITDLAPQEVRPVVCRLSWNSEWKADETARVEFDFGPGKRVWRALVPSQCRVHRAKKMALDGRLHDWGPDTQLPAWMLGSTAAEAHAAVHLAWAEEGLYVAVVAHDSKRMVKDPASFWAGDALELFLDSADNKQVRSAAAGDHHFWFVPLTESHRVYMGQWKMGKETSATRYDIPGVRGAAQSTADGYVMEFLLPAAEIQGYRPQAGSALGLNLNLTVQGGQSSREVYWPSPKNSGVTAHPERWGTVLLVP